MDRDRIAAPKYSLLAAPRVDPDFWQTGDMPPALASRHMGRVVRAFRTHPHLQRSGLSQEEVGRWVGITQGQLSRIESGPPIAHLDRLIQWARVLRIPQEHLWFTLPDEGHLAFSGPGADLDPGGVAGVSASIHDASRLMPATDGEIPDEPTSLVDASAAEATALVNSAARAGYDLSALIGRAYAEADDLAKRYLTSPPGPILRDAHEWRRRVLLMLHDRIPPGRASDLYLVAGLLSGISAYACLDLGHPEAATTQAEAGHVCASYAGHDGLRAWMYGTGSLIARYEGRYHQALDLARRGLRHATSGTALDRLRCGEAQSLACLGDRAATRHALNLADEAREKSTTPDVAGGIFGFSEAKHVYYFGSSLIWLTEPEDAALAEEHADRSIALFSAEPPDQRNLVDEALAHVYLGTARVTLGDLDGVLSAIRPVLDVPPDRRISWQRKRLARLGTLLNDHRFNRSPLVGAIQEEISAFSDSHS